MCLKAIDAHLESPELNQKWAALMFQMQWGSQPYDMHIASSETNQVNEYWDLRGACAKTCPPSHKCDVSAALKMRARTDQNIRPSCVDFLAPKWLLPRYNGSTQTQPSDQTSGKRCARRPRNISAGARSRSDGSFTTIMSCESSESHNGGYRALMWRFLINLTAILLLRDLA